MLLLSLAAVGAKTLLAHHLSTGAIVKVGVYAIHHFTIGQIVTTAVVGTAIVGGYVMTRESAGYLENGTKAVLNKNYKEAAIEFGKLLYNVKSACAGVVDLPDFVTDALTKMHVPAEKVALVHSWVQNNQNAISHCSRKLV